MKILYLLNSLGVGGAERLTMALAVRMEKRGHEVAILVLKPSASGDLRCPVTAVHCDISGNPVKMLVGTVKALRFLRAFQPAIMHSHGFHSNMFARVLGFFSRAPVVSTVHNVYEGGWLRMLAYRATDLCSTRTVAVSDGVAERMAELGAISSKRGAIIRNAIELEIFAPDTVARESTRANLDVAQEFLWLAVGRDAPAKDYPTLLIAFESLLERFPQARLAIAGAAFPKGEPLQMLSAPLGDSVRWLGMRNDIAELLCAADGFVASSAWEGMPLAIAEAMSAELPVVATEVGGVAELVGYAGLLVPPRQPKKLAEAMVAIMERTGESRHELGVAARQRIREEFSMAARVEEWERLYSEVLARL